MPTDQVTLEVLNPTPAARTTPPRSLSQRVARLEGKRIGIVDNGKAASAMLVPTIRQALAARFAGIETRVWDVPLGLSPEEKAPALREAAAWGDGVVTLIGD